MTSLTTQIISPKQASQIFGQSRAFPKQRNVFLVRFLLNGTGASSASALTYAVKACDRPIIEPVTEEVNQYNKKRQIHTGYKKSTLKCVFYDDAKSSAQTMWASYAQYYFGDFNTNNGTNNAFSDDVISNQFQDPNKTGFGFIPQSNKWFFKSISILHLHNAIYDLYTLVNPRITVFSPDELDYEQSGIATITATFVYEAVIFQPNYGGQNSGASSQPEFSASPGSSGFNFNGSTNGTQADGITEPGSSPSTSTAPLSSITSGIQSLVNGAGQSVSSIGAALGSALNSSYYNTPSTGPLGAFGNFIFGPNSNGASPTASQLASLAQANPALAQTLGLGSLLGNPLAAAAPLGVYATTAGYTGAPPSYPGTVAGISAAMTSTYGNIGQLVAQGALASTQISGTNSGYSTTAGLQLAAQALGIINTQQPGTVQYGYNAQSGAGNTTPVSLGATPASTPVGATAAQAPASTQTSAAPATPSLPIPPIPPATPPTAPAVANPNMSPDNSNPAPTIDPDSGVALA